jgi:uncharacterized Tic20 family protein
MNQPELGLKVSELRQLKGFTQEQLAEKCEVSTRTVQRIENGEVDPRAYTLHCLGDVLEFDFEEQNNSQENIWLVIMHLSSCIVMLIVPLVMWSIKKGKSLKIDTQGRQILNFQITMTLLLFMGGFILMVVPIALVALKESGMIGLQGDPTFMLLILSTLLPLVLTGIFCTIEGVINALRSLADKPVRYPLSIPFVR